MNLLSGWGRGQWVWRVRQQKVIDKIPYSCRANTCSKEKQIKVRRKSHSKGWKKLLFRYGGQKKKAFLKRWLFGKALKNMRVWGKSVPQWTKLSLKTQNKPVCVEHRKVWGKDSKKDQEGLALSWKFVWGLILIMMGSLNRFQAAEERDLIKRGGSSQPLYACSFEQKQKVNLASSSGGPAERVVSQTAVAETVKSGWTQYRFRKYC